MGACTCCGAAGGRLDLDTAHVPAAPAGAPIPHAGGARRRRPDAPGRRRRCVRAGCQHGRAPRRGITPATPDPAGGVIVRDAAGEPTGLLRNVGALLSRFDTRTGKGAPPLDWLARVHERYAAVGITSIVERAASVEGYRAYEQLHAEGRLQLRAVVTLLVQSDGTWPAQSSSCGPCRRVSKRGMTGSGAAR